MDRYERDELAQLIVDWVRAAVEAAAALYEEPLDMSEWVATADREQNARRECWEALFRLPIQEKSGPQHRAL